MCECVSGPGDVRDRKVQGMEPNPPKDSGKATSGGSVLGVMGAGWGEEQLCPAPGVAGQFWVMSPSSPIHMSGLSTTLPL